MAWSTTFLACPQLGTWYAFTSSPSSYTGPIGRVPDKCEDLHLVASELVDSNIPDNCFADGNCDQQFLHEIAKSVKTGYCSHNLSLKKLGPLSHARMLCTSSRVVRLYVATESPSPQLVALVLFIL